MVASGRIAGSDRYATAAQVALETYQRGVGLVYLASGTSSTDAPTAGAANAPLLLVAEDRVPAVTAQALRALGPARVVVVGGTTAISATVEAQVRTITGTTVTRIGGADRYETAALLATDRFRDGVGTVYVVTGQNFPDGVAAGAVAGQNNAALVLVPGSGLPQSVITAVKAMKPERIVVVGGTAAVNAATLTALREFAPQVDRIGGVNRYDIAAQLTAGAASGRPVILVTGHNFPDALVSATLARRNGASVLMVATGVAPEVTRGRVETLEPAGLIFIGGPRAVTPTVELRMGRLLDPATPALW